MEKSLWLMSLKVRILRSSPLAMDDSEFADVEAAMFADSNEKAEVELSRKLEESKLELMEMYHSSYFEDAKWLVGDENRDDILELVEEVKFSGAFRFGLFRDLIGTSF